MCQVFQDAPLIEEWAWTLYGIIYWMFIIPSYLFPKKAVIVRLAGVTNVTLPGVLRSRVGREGSRQRDFSSHFSPGSPIRN